MLKHSPLHSRAKATHQPHWPRYLGISLEAAKGVTPEIYPSQLPTRPEKFIIPGIKTEEDLTKVLTVLDSLKPQCQ